MSEITNKKSDDQTNGTDDRIHNSYLLPIILGSRVLQESFAMLVTDEEQVFGPFQNFGEEIQASWPGFLR